MILKELPKEFFKYIVKEWFQRFNKTCHQELSSDFSKQQALLGEVLYAFP
jgi:hypothetical protein